MPMNIVVNTEKKLFYILIPGYFKVSVPALEDISTGIKMRVLFFNFRIKPKVNKSNTESKNTSKKNKGRLRKPFLLFQKTIKKFTIKKCNVNIDTGDFPLNAQLIPVASMLSNNNMNFQINFEDRNELDIHIITRIGILIGTFLKHRITTN